MEPWRVSGGGGGGYLHSTLIPFNISNNMVTTSTTVNSNTSATSCFIQPILSQVGSVTEQLRITRSTQIEANLNGSGSGNGNGGNASSRFNTAFVGSIPEGVTDEVLERLLQSCGPVIRWKRVTDAANMPKSFGFCDFGSADSMNRALSLLHDLPLLSGRRLIVKVDEATKTYLDRYQTAMAQGQVEMSSREADLSACQSIRIVLKEKNFYAALEAIDRRITQLSAEAPEEGEAIDDDDDDGRGGRGGDNIEGEKDRNRNRDRDRNRDHRDKELNDREKGGHENRKSRRESSRELSKDRRGGGSQGKQQQERGGTGSGGDTLTNQQLKAFKERESRWEAREAQMLQRHRRMQQAERERSERTIEEREYAAKYLSSFEDFDWLISSLDRLVGIVVREISLTGGGRIPDFYTNRELWKSRRSRDREREEELDRRDEEVEQRQKKIETTKGVVEDSGETARLGALDNANVTTPTGTGGGGNGNNTGGGGAVTKKTRPTAAEFLSAVEEDLTLKKRKLLIPRDYSREELLAAGYSSMEATVKLKQLYKDKVLRLIEIIPVKKEELFAWPIDWKNYNPGKMLELIRRKTSLALKRARNSEREVERISQSLASQIQQHAEPETIITWMIEDGMLIENHRASKSERYEEASIFVAILWRHLVYETEATAYNLVPEAAV